eukprot:2059590-Karenia_brevis.AAC.1
MDARRSPHPSARLHLEILHLAQQMRAHPTVPADPANPEEPVQTVFDDSMAPKLPRKHCAFKHCLWHGESDTDLLAHISSSQHEQVIQPAADALPHCFAEGYRIFSAYNEAIAEKIREGA